MQNVTAVVGGFPQISAALRQTGLFAEVVDIDATSGIRDMDAAGHIGTPGSTVFILADNLNCDTGAIGLDRIVQHLSNSGFVTIVLNVDGFAQSIIDVAPSAGNLGTPVAIQNVLGALAGLGVTGMRPINEPWAEQMLSQSGTPVDFAPAPAPAPAPVVPATEFAAPAADGFAAPAADGFAAPAADGFAAPAADGFAAPAADGFAAPADEFISPAADGFAAPADEFISPADEFISPAAATVEVPAEDMSDWHAVLATAAEGVTVDATEVVEGFATPAHHVPTQDQANQAPFAVPGAPAPVEEFPSFSSSVDAAPLAQPFAPAPAPVQPAPAPVQPMAAPVQPAPAPVQPMAAPVQPLLPQAPTQAIAAPVAAPMASMPAAPQRNPGRRGQVIVITCPKGGVGKTSLAHNLAAYHALSCPDRRILVFDGNPQQADANNLLSGWEDGVRNVTDILKDTAFNNISLNEETVMRYVTDRREAFGFDVMFGPRESQDSDPMFVNAAFMKDVLEKLRPHYDAIFVDTPVANPHEPMINDFALKVADYLLVTWGPSDSESINAERWIENVITSDPLVNGRESFPQDRVGVVINRWREGTNFNIDEARRGIATVNWLGLVPDHVAWIAAQNSSTLIARYNIQEFNEAFARILGSVTGEPIYASGAPVQAAPQNEGISGRFRRFLRGT